jgi:hypothetical protein
MNTVKKLGQVDLNDRSIAVLDISLCFGDGSMSAAFGAESVTATVKGRFEDRLHDLEQRLLNHPVDDIGNAQPSLSAARLRKPDAANIARSVTSLKQVTAQTREQRALAPPPSRPSVRPLPALPGCALRSAARAPDWLRSLLLRAADCRRPRRRSDRSSSCASLCAAESFASRIRPGAFPFRPRRAVGEHEAHLPWSALSQSISPFALPAFAGLLATMRRSDFCMGFVPSSSPPSGLPLARTHADLPG